MAQENIISGFSKMTAAEKIRWLAKEFDLSEEDKNILESHLHSDSNIQSQYNEFSENTVSNFYIPFGLAPNFLINGNWYVIPMAIEESSVVAAASHAAKFWSTHGGFKAEVLSKVKIGQVHFQWTGEVKALHELFSRGKNSLIRSVDALTSSMRNRGAGIQNIQLLDHTLSLEYYYTLHVEFLTGDAMGANFINTVLEQIAKEWEDLVDEERRKTKFVGELEIIMSILSNYNPESIVKIYVESDVNSFEGFDEHLSGPQFAQKFVSACDIANADMHRAVTHNKGIYNGIDAVVIATGNDFRAVEACGHAYASRDGRYRSLSKATIVNNTFRFELLVPMSVGTVGGMTSGHPLAKTSLKILKHPTAEDLMMIIAAAGLANNFNAIKSLITGGIQIGHMKMHLSNILQQLGANATQKKKVTDYFKDKTISFTAVRTYLEELKP